VNDLVQDYIYKHKLTDFPVFNRDEFVGMVSLEGVKTVTKELWGFKQVRDIMKPAEIVPFLRPTDEASEALARMLSGDLEQMPVMEDSHFLGIVSRRDIMSLFKIKSDIGVA
jgi:CBS domain-containing protein